jgi:hypothetical protein
VSKTPLAGDETSEAGAGALPDAPALAGAQVRAGAWALPAAAAAGVAVFVVANAWAGLMPGVGFWDTGEFQTVLPLMGTAHPTGFPTYVLIGFLANLLLAPIGEPAFRINALSLIAVAAAAGVTVELVRRLTGSIPVGVAAAIGLAVTPDVWANATRADPHPLHLLFVAVILVLLVGWEGARRRDSPHPDRWLVAAAAAFGLSAGNHSLTLLLAPPIGLFVLLVDPGILRRPRLIATCAVALAAVLVGVYLELPVRAGLVPAPLVYGRPDTWDGFWYVALAQQFVGSLSHPFDDLLGKAGNLWLLAQEQFGTLAFLVPLGFLATVRRAPRYAVLTGLAMLITVVFNASYANADINRYYLGPILWAWTWIACLVAELAAAVVLVAAVATRQRPADAMALAGPVVAGLLALGLLVPSVSDLSARGFAADRHLDPGAAPWLEQVLPALDPDAVVVSWWSTSTPLWYATLVEGRRSDIAVIDDQTILDRDYGNANGAIAWFLGSRPVYVIRANERDIAQVRATYQLEPVAGSASLTVYKVLGPAG